MSEAKKYLQGFSAYEIIKHAYPETIEKLILDLQHQVNDYQQWKDNHSKEGHRLSSKEMYELNADIAERTIYIKSLLEFHADYNWTGNEIRDLCKYYNIKTFWDNLPAK